MKLNMILLLLLAIKGSQSCKRSDSASSVGEGVVQWQKNFNCTNSSLIGDRTTMTVENSTAVICEIVLIIPGFNSRNLTEDEARLCSYLGNTTCPACANDSSHEDRVQDVNVSCLREEATTIGGSTAAESTTFTVDDSSTLSTFQMTAVGGKPLKSSDIAIFIAVGAIAVLFIIAAVVIFKRKQRRKKRRESEIQKSSEEDILRVEASSNGELYTVISKKHQDPAMGMTENILYATSGQEVEIIDNNALYSAVNKDNKRAQNGDKIQKSSEEDLGAGSNGDLYTDVNKKNDAANDEQVAVIADNGALYTAVNQDNTRVQTTISDV